MCISGIQTQSRSILLSAGHPSAPFAGPPTRPPAGAAGRSRVSPVVACLRAGRCARDPVGVCVTITHVRVWEYVFVDMLYIGRLKGESATRIQV